MLRVGLKTIDSHEVEEVDALLENWSTLSKSTISMEVLIEEEASLRRLLSYYHTKDTRNMLCLRCVIWENPILSLVTHGYINIIWRSTGKQEKWK